MNFEDYVYSSYAMDNGVIPKTVEKREDGRFYVENEDATYHVSRDLSFEQQLAKQHDSPSLTVFGRRLKDDTHWFDVYVASSFRTVGIQLMVSPSKGIIQEGFIAFESDDYPTDDFETDNFSFTDEEKRIAKMVLHHLHQYVDEHPKFRLPLLTGILQKK